MYLLLASEKWLLIIEDLIQSPSYSSIFSIHFFAFQKRVDGTESLTSPNFPVQKLKAAVFWVALKFFKALFSQYQNDFRWHLSSFLIFFLIVC